VGTVTDVRQETPGAKSIVLDVPEWPGQLAGMHVDVRLTAEDGYQAERSYSIASAPEDAGLAITVERIEDGEVSPYLTEELRPGDSLELRGPIGGYFAWHVDEGGPLVLVGGGSGLVPLMAMLRHRRRESSRVDTRLLLSARTLAEVLYGDELAQAAGDGLAIHYTLTRERSDRWKGWNRRVDAEMLSELGPPPDKRPLFYVCGPTPFVESVADLLVGFGHPADRVRTERFRPTGGQMEAGELHLDGNGVAGGYQGAGIVLRCPTATISALYSASWETTATSSSFGAGGCSGGRHKIVSPGGVRRIGRPNSASGAKDLRSRV
jgi:ferredoxin-NADP reductase